jgi:hypothetical protein
MRTLPSFLAGLAVALLGCGGSSPPAETPPPAEAPAGDTPTAGDAEPAAAGGSEASEPAPAGGGDKAEPPAASESESTSLARDLVKSGGRRIGYSSQKKGFAIGQQRRAGADFSVDVLFTDEDGNTKDTIRVCQPADCAENLKELANAAIPKLASRLESEGYVPVRAIGWPSGRDELDVSSIGMKLKLTGGQLEGVRDGKPKARLGAVKPQLLAIFVVPGTKLLGVLTSPDGDPGSQSFSVLKLPVVTK